ncbi:MAG: CRTAC1 family protein [Acidobacteriota bacterium]
MSLSLSSWPTLVAASACLIACGDVIPEQPVSSPATSVSTSRTLLAELDLDFHHEGGFAGEYFMPELYGAGAALFDFDNDGDLDIYLVQGRCLTRDCVPNPEHVDRLLRNDLDGDGPVFTDVTQSSGIDARGYGMGVMTGDIDNDGWTDLYVTNWSAPGEALPGNQLWRNRGDGTFENATATSATGDVGWSVAAVFLDLDPDDLLDLYVGRYLNVSRGLHRRCTTDLGGPDYCNPTVFTPQTDRFFHNRGNGRFEDITSKTGLDSALPLAGLGAVALELTDDAGVSRPALYVANDQFINQLWILGEDGTWVDQATTYGLAVNGRGAAEASMGIAVGDADEDGDFDLLLTHLDGETHTFYRNDEVAYTDVTDAVGLAASSLPMTGFGVGFHDFDGDGHLDILAVNGDVKVIPDLLLQGDTFPFHQRDQVFRRRAEALVYDEVSATAGPAFARSEVGRGAAFGDLDNDGDVDVVITTNHGPARALIQLGQPEPSTWVGIRAVIPVGDGAVRDALGTILRVHRDGQPSLLRRVATDGSYASASDPRVTVRLGQAAPAVDVEACWPHRGCEWFRRVATGRYTTLVRGQGESS